MAAESIQGDGSFYLKPGGTREEEQPTDLNANQYSQISGVDRNGATAKMPGKKLIVRYSDPVLAIAQFGNGVFVQHGTTLVLYPDACAVAAAPDPVTPPPSDFAVQTTGTGYVQSGLNSDIVRFLMYQVDDLDNVLDRTHELHSWSWEDISTDGELDLLIPFQDYLPEFPCDVAFCIEFPDSGLGPDYRLLIHHVIAGGAGVTEHGPYINIAEGTQNVTLALSGLD